MIVVVLAVALFAGSLACGGRKAASCAIAPAQALLAEGRLERGIAELRAVRRPGALI